MRPHRFRRALEVLRTEGPLAFARKAARHGAEMVKRPFGHSRRLKIAAELLRTTGYRALVERVAQTSREALKATIFRARYAEQRNLRLMTEELRNKTINVRSKPRNITIESTTYCNLKCVMCEHGFDGIEVNKRHFPERLVPRLASFLATATHFQLHGLGEPLMSPAFWMLLEKITSVHRGAPEITFNSNAMLLNEKNIARILATKTREMNISFDAATPQTYARIRGADFSKLLANVSALVQARNKAGRTDLKISINMTLMRANIEELPKFIRLAKQLGVDEVRFWRMNEGDNYERPDWIIDKDDWRFAYSQESLKHYPNLVNAMVREAVRVAAELNMPPLQDEQKLYIDGEGQREDWQYNPAAESSASPPRVTAVLPVIEAPEKPAAAAPENLVQLQVDAASGVPAPKSSTIGKCAAPWNWLLVNNRGDCMPCCYLQGTIGNLERQSIDEIWNGSTVQEIRKSIARDEIHPLCRGASCQYVRGEQEAVSTVH
jgi:MoaA/NifB/PqqE/SkfB family radical SAM enzyme